MLLYLIIRVILFIFLSLIMYIYLYSDCSIDIHIHKKFNTKIYSFLCWILSKCCFQKLCHCYGIIQFLNILFLVIIVQISWLVLKPAQIISHEVHRVTAIASQEYNSMMISIFCKWFDWFEVALTTGKHQCIQLSSLA